MASQIWKWHGWRQQLRATHTTTSPEVHVLATGTPTVWQCMRHAVFFVPNSHGHRCTVVVVVVVVGCLQNIHMAFNMYTHTAVYAGALLPQVPLVVRSLAVVAYSSYLYG